MLSAVVILALACFCEARPSFNAIARPSFAMEPFIVGGVEATKNEFPWQLSQQRQGTSGWSHSCGASLLSAKYALSASHCVDGAAVSILRVVAGLHNRTLLTDGVISNVESVKMHESYNVGDTSYANDIAILTLAQEIQETDVNIKYASLPDDNVDQFVNRTCVISGWGRNSATNTLPDLLQKASINVISTASCNSLLSGVSGAIAGDSNVCLYDTANSVGSCNGDSGGPLNCNYPTADDSRQVVFGVTSWGISGPIRCLQSYPSVYTRVAYYLDWIKTNTLE